PADSFDRESAALNEELDRLRDTFQTEYDKAKAAAEEETAEASGPEIQALDDNPEEEPEEEVTEEAEQQTAKTGRKKTGLPKKIKALIIALVLICLVIIGPLLSYFIITLRIPSFNSFLSAYARGRSATDAAEQVSCYTEALSYASEDDTLNFFTQELHERIAVAKCETDGYAAAISYADENLTSEMRENPKTREFRSLLQIGGVIEEIAAKATDTVAQALGDDADTAALDYEDLALSLGTPEVAMETVTQALKTLAEGISLEKTAETKEDFQNAMKSYLSAYSLFNDLGATAQPMLESICVKLYDRGFAYEAELVLNQYFTEETLAKSENEAFAEVQKELDALKGTLFDPAALAETQIAAGATQETDFTSAVAAADTGLSEKGQYALALLAQTVADAILAENEHNLTKANTFISTALAAEETLSLPTSKTAQHAITVSMTLGDIDTAYQQAGNHITESVLKDAPEEFKALHAELLQINAAKDAVDEVFYPFYSTYAYYGTELDKEEITAALDELLTEDASYYTIAYVNYYKYIAEALTDADYAQMQKHLERFADAMQDYPLLYGNSMIQLYLAQDKNEKAVTLAKYLLEINIADDLGNSMLALDARMQGDVHASLDAAKRGMELSGAEDYSAHQAVIAYLLLDDYQAAYELAYRLYESSLTVENCETLKVIAVTYDGDDADLKNQLDDISAEIDSVYAQYNVTYSDAAQAVIDGEKTPEDIFLSGSFDLR
ncbi:MAG: hypothetical protein IJT27_00405, partial [Clostridia bacterium]|nr:hypothetical protein [Clostridia bacterium]